MLLRVPTRIHRQLPQTSRAQPHPALRRQASIVVTVMRDSELIRSPTLGSLVDGSVLRVRRACIARSGHVVGLNRDVLDKASRLVELVARANRFASSVQQSEPLEEFSSDHRSTPLHANCALGLRFCTSFLCLNCAPLLVSDAAWGMPAQQAPRSPSGDQECPRILGHRSVRGSVDRPTPRVT